jgi:hypothetical protein
MWASGLEALADDGGGGKHSQHERLHLVADTFPPAAGGLHASDEKSECARGVAADCTPRPDAFEVIAAALLQPQCPLRSQTVRGSLEDRGLAR